MRNIIAKKLDAARAAVAGAREGGPSIALAVALRNLGEIHRNAGDFVEGRVQYEEAVSLLRGLDEPLRLAHTIRHLSMLHRDAGEAEKGEACQREAVSLYRRHSEAPSLDLANAIRYLAVAVDESGATDEAIELWKEAHDRYAALRGGLKEGVAEAAAHVALLLGARGEAEDSGDWLTRASEAAEASKDRASIDFVRGVGEKLSELTSIDWLGGLSPCREAPTAAISGTCRSPGRSGFHRRG